jgi:hypothetical protein
MLKQSWNTEAGTQNAGIRKVEERMKERETAVGVEKSGRNFSLKLDWQLRKEEHNVA